MSAKTRDTIVFLHSSDELYGADRMLLLMLGALEGRASVEVWLPNDLEHPDHPLCHELDRRGVPMRHLKLPIMRRALRTPRGIIELAARSLQLTRELRRAAPTSVYCTTTAALLCASAARLAGVRTVLAHVQEAWSVSDARLLAPAAKACDRLIAISSAVRDTLPTHVQSRTSVVLNATTEPPDVASPAGRNGALRYVIASRWNGWKGHRTLLSAWNGAGSPGHLTVLGSAPLSGDRVDVRAAVAALDHPETVTVVGEVGDAGPHLQASDVVLLPSDRPEPFGLVVIEAFARGRPVIASGAGGPLEIITPGRDGWLFRPGDVGSLTAVLAEMDRRSVAAAGLEARDTYERRFTVDRWAAQWRAEVLGALAGAR